MNGEGSFLKTAMNISNYEIHAHMLQQILDILPQAVCILSEGKIIYNNSSADSFFKSSPDKLKGSSLTSLSPRFQSGGKLTEQVEMDGLQTAIDGSRWSEQWIFQQSDGSQHEADLVLTRVGAEGSYAVLAMITDNAPEKSISQENEVFRIELANLAKNIEKLAEGDLNLKYSMSDSGNSSETSIQFLAINNNLKKAVDALNLMMEDVMMLSESAINGILDTRADITRHEGDYTLVIQGINEILDAILLPLQEGIRVCGAYAENNFNAAFNPDLPVSGNFQNFRDNLNTIGDKISGVILNFKKEITDLSEFASNASSGIEDVRRGAGSIASNAEESSKYAEKAEEGIQQVLQAMSDLTTLVTDISRDADEVAHLSEQANDEAMKGTEHAGAADTGMKSITTSSTEVDRNITEIRNEMGKISKIVKIITDLANQTNLLALNAAIEAARAGDAGRGFAVVAAEVKSLAQESRASAESITDMIQGLERKSENAATAIDAAGSAVKEGSQALSDTLVIFTELTRSVMNINDNMIKIAKSTEHEAASFEEITASAHEMSSLVKRTAEDAIQSSATAEEAIAIVTQITNIIEMINKSVSTMEMDINSFKVR